MKQNLNPAGWLRLVIYVLSALTGIAAVVVNALGYADLSVLVGTVAGAGAAITGGTAVANLPKADDQHPTAGFEVNEAIPAILDIAAAARAYQTAVEYQPRHAAEEELHNDPTAAYAASVRGE